MVKPRIRERAPDAPTPREVEMWQWMAAGYTVRKAATRMFISNGTARGHLLTLMRKLNVHNRVELLNEGRARGMR